MLSIKLIQQNPQEVIDRLKVKNFRADEVISKAIESDNNRRKTQFSLDQLLAEMNKTSKEIGELFKSGKAQEANDARQKTNEMKEEIKVLEQKLKQHEDELTAILVTIPNLPHESVPAGKSAEDNIEVRAGGDIPELKGDFMAHWDLAKKYDLIDFDLGNKITGAGFPVFKGKGARLQRALISFFLDQASENGYTEFIPPLMVNEDSAFGTGQLPDKDGQMYYVGLDNLYLIPTAEVPVTNIFRDVILDNNQLPVKCTAYTPCFRREAGSYGKDVRGLNRVHQFDKVEIVRVESPEVSYKALDEMVAYVESLVQKLGLPYRILKLCGGDMSFTSALTYDFEVFSAGQNKWLEVSSVSNFESYQATRLKLRYRDDEKKAQIAHTLNGSALALPRIVAAILENNQTPEGIVLPDVLVPYTGFKIIN